MKYLRASMNFNDVDFGEIESFYMYECPSFVTNFYNRISKEIILEYLKNGNYECACESYVMIADDEFDEFKRQFQAAVKIRHLNELAKNAE